MAIEHLLDTTIDVKRPAPTKDTSGGIVANESDAYSSIAATIQPAGGSIVVKYAQQHVDISHTIFVGQILSMQNGDWIESGGVKYFVKAWRDLAGKGRVMAIDVLEETA